jgi:hypothetical protein
MTTRRFFLATLSALILLIVGYALFFNERPSPEASTEITVSGLENGRFFALSAERI